jgi:hypothetical protein
VGPGVVEKGIFGSKIRGKVNELLPARLVFTCLQAVSVVCAESRVGAIMSGKCAWVLWCGVRIFIQIEL